MSETKSADWVRPAKLMSFGVMLACLFIAAHLMGLREYTTFISGTPVSVESGIYNSTFWGAIYVLLYLGCVLVAPIFLLAGLLLVAWNKVCLKPDGDAKA